MYKIPVIAIVGPTASGKTALSLPLAGALSGQIVAMDSMQVYRGMDIGTAKPTRQEQALVKHHLIDVCNPCDAFSVSDYAQLAAKAIEQITAKGDVPILVGGTGFYLKALLYGLSLGGAKGDPALRAALESQADTQEGKLDLHSRLAKVDPPAAQKLHPNDVRRVVRALEVYELTGKPFSSQQETKPDPDSPYRFLILGASLPRETLYCRINQRVEQMMALGLMSEVRALLESGVSADAQAMQGLGYKELVPVVCQGAPLKAAVEAIQKGTRHYAKRQMTWFRAEKDVCWLDMAQPEVSLKKALTLSRAFLSQDWKDE